MSRAGFTFFGLVAALAITIDVLYWSNPICAPAREGIFGSDWPGPCAEFWIYRYQTLLTGIAAIGAAWMIVAAMRAQTEHARRDLASQKLSRYAAALALTARRYSRLPTLDSPDQTARNAAISLLNESIDSADFLEAMSDDLLGPDSGMLALYTTCLSNSAAYPQAGDIVGNRWNLIAWPLYLDLNNSLIERRKMLANGATVSSLAEISTISHRKFRRAYITGEPIVK